VTKPVWWGLIYLPKIQKLGAALLTNAQKVKDIIACLEGVVPAFETSLIHSDDYRDKATAVHQSMRALAELHPNWSDEGHVVVGGNRDGVPPLDTDDPLSNIYLHSEQLFHAWNKMKIVRPSIRALADGCADFRDALEKLRQECAATSEPKSPNQ
jgi:hypothetical protein